MLCSILDCIAPSQFNENSSSHQPEENKQMHVEFSFDLHSPPQINLSIVISVMTGLEFSHHTDKTWEMSKCIGHKYRK